MKAFGFLLSLLALCSNAMAAFGFGSSKSEVPENYKALAAAYLKLPANAHVRYYQLADGYLRDPKIKTGPDEWVPILQVEYKTPAPDGGMPWGTNVAYVVLGKSGVRGDTRKECIRWSDAAPQPEK